MTPAAIAQQVKALENWTGAKLFKRNAHGVDLTPLGARVLADFSLAFDQLGIAVQNLRTSAAPLEIRIAALPSIAQLWVSPRLPKIRLAMPELSISVSALEQKPSLVREPFDMAIFFDHDQPGDNSWSIGRDMIFPVCTPAIARRLSQVEDLANEVFLHDSTWSDDWKAWLAVASPSKNLNKSGPEFSLYALALEECKNGAGILIGHEALVRPHLEAGELVAPFKTKVSLPRYLALSALNLAKSGSPLAKVAAMLMTEQ